MELLIYLFQTNIKDRESSVVVRDTWKVVEDIDFLRLTKLSLPTVETPEDL